MADNKTKTQKLVDKAKSNPYQKYRTLIYPNELGQPTEGHTNYMLFNINSTVYQSSGTSDAKDLGGSVGIVTQSPTGRNLNYNVSNLGKIKKPIPRTNVSIALPMTETSVGATYDASWSSIDLGVAGGMKVMGTSVTDAAKEMAEEIQKGSTFAAEFETAKAGISSNVSLGQVGIAAMQAVMGEQITQAFKLIPDRQAENARQEVIFKSVSNRTFSFKHTLVAKSPQEAETIQAIIDTFKYAMMPSLLGGQNGYFGYPDEFDITFWQVDGNGNVRENDYIHKISTCACTKVDVDYGGVGRYAVYYDGRPVAITLNLSFTELEFLTKERIEEGF